MNDLWYGLLGSGYQQSMSALRDPANDPIQWQLARNMTLAERQESMVEQYRSFWAWAEERKKQADAYTMRRIEFVDDVANQTPHLLERCL